MIGIDRRLGELYVLEQLHVVNVAASSVDLSSFRLSPKSFFFIFGILVWDMCLRLVYIFWFLLVYWDR